MSRAGGIKVVVVLGLILVIGLVYFYRPDHKYRLKVEVDTPHGLKSAAGVMAVYKDKLSIGGIGGGTATQGDAIFLDLGDGRNLIAILGHGENGSDVDGMNYLAMNAFAAAGQKVPFKDVKRLSGTVPVQGYLIPTLVTFSDPIDPKTARVVDPGNIEAAFGNGYRLISVTLDVVPVGFWPLDFGGPLGEPVTRRIEGPLPWVAQLKSQGLGGRIQTYPDRFTVNVPYFTRS